MKGGSGDLSKESQIINCVFNYASMNEKLPNLSDAFSFNYYTFYKQIDVEPEIQYIYINIL